MARTPVYTLAVLGVIVGQAVMLYGVFLTSGATMNVPMVAGGVVVIAAIGLLAAGLFGEDETPA